MMWRLCIAAFLTAAISLFALNAPHAQFNGCPAGFCNPPSLSASFTPASLPGLLVWLDASVSGSITTDVSCLIPATDTQSVSCWKDQSGNANNFLKYTNSPTYAAAGLNSLPTVVVLASSTQSLKVSSFAIGTGTTGSAFAVCMMTTNTNNNGRLLSYMPVGDTNDFTNTTAAAWIFRNGTNNSFETFRGGTSVNDAIPLSTPKMFGAIFTGSNMVPYVGSSSGTSTAFSSAWGSPGPLALFETTQGGTVWDGDCSELIVSSSDITSYVSQLFTYENAKWGGL